MTTTIQRGILNGIQWTVHLLHTKTMIDTHLTSIAQQLVNICAPRRQRYEGGFTKTIIVSDECRGGDIDVSITKVVINPFFFTNGDPLAIIEHVLDVCVEFDHEHRLRTTRAIADLKQRLRSTLRLLQQYDPDSIQSIIEDELGMGEEDVLHLELSPAPQIES